MNAEGTINTVRKIIEDDIPYGGKGNPRLEYVATHFPTICELALWTFRLEPELMVERAGRLAVNRPAMETIDSLQRKLEPIPEPFVEEKKMYTVYCPHCAWHSHASTTQVPIKEDFKAHYRNRHA